MGYKLNREIRETERTAVYIRSELELMSEHRLRDICRKEHIVKGLSQDLNENELIEIILKYCKSLDELLIHQERAGGRERIEAILENVSVKPLEGTEFRVAGKISIYEGADVDFADAYKLAYDERFLNTNALIISGDRTVCSIFNVVAMGDEKENLFLVKDVLIESRVTDIKNYSLYFMEAETSRFIYNEYMEIREDTDSNINRYRMYKIPLMDFEILPLIKLNMPVALDFGSTNTTAAIYADSSYYRQINAPKIKGIKENTICHTLFYESVGGEAFIESMIPSVVSVINVESEKVEYAFGRKALWFSNLSYTDKGFSVFYDIKRWVGDFQKPEEVIDSKGRYRHVKRIEIIAEFIQHVLNTTRDRFKCRIEEVYITVPVKQKHSYEEMLDILSEMLGIRLKLSLDESTAVLYSFITKMREKEKLQDGKSYKALIMDCGGGTTDLNACTFRVESKGDIQTYVMENSYKNGNTDFGGNNITYRLMQLLKIKIVSALGLTDQDLADEIMDRLPADPYRYIDENGVESFYSGLRMEYEKVEKTLPTGFKRYEIYGREEYYKVRNNHFFLFSLADEIKQRLFSGNEISVTVPEDKNAKSGILRLEADRWKISFFDGERLSVLENIPKISFNRYEVEKLITGEIYAVMKNFMERLYSSGELYNFDMIRLTGQSCKIGIFRDALKEFIPGIMMHSASVGNKEELKMACVDGLMRYLYDKKTGYAGFHIRDEAPTIPYKIKALSYRGHEEVLIDGFKSVQYTGSLLRKLEDILLRLYLCDASESVRFEYMFNFKKDGAKRTDKEELAKLYEGHIKQEDTDDIANEELKIFAFTDYSKWGFKIVPVYRLEDVLYVGDDMEYKYETDEWICDFFDGEH